MIRGHPTKLSISEEVRAAVAEVPDHRVAPGDRRGDERRSGARLSALSGTREDGVVGFAHRGRERVGWRGAVRRGEESPDERVDGRGARGPDAGLSPDAVRDREQRRAALFAHDKTVLALLS